MLEKMVETLFRRPLKIEMIMKSLAVKCGEEGHHEAKGYQAYYEVVGRVNSLLRYEEFSLEDMDSLLFMIIANHSIAELLQMLRASHGHQSNSLKKLLEDHDARREKRGLLT